jgi:arylsulfatase A-like enzyme
MRPNILLITADQLRKDALGCYGNTVVDTPNIDRLAERGMVFEQMYTASPVCAPDQGTARGAGRSSALASSMDIMPTCLSLAGLDVPEGVQGLSLAGHLKEPDRSLREELLIEMPPPVRTIRTRRHRLTWHADDPDCFRNLWNESQAAELRRELTERLLGLMTAKIDPLPPKVGR